jgi:hypothetical protein
MEPADAQETWTAVETDRPRDWRWHAGVYQSGTRLLALNRPRRKTPRSRRTRASSGLLHGAKLTVMSGALALKADRLQSEIWPAMVILTMLFMCAEMLLATSKAMLPQKPAAARSRDRRRGNANLRVARHDYDLRQFRIITAPWVIAVACAFVVASAWFFIRSPASRRRRRLDDAAARAAFAHRATHCRNIAAPGARRGHNRSEKPGVVILWDASGSMATRDAQTASARPSPRADW